LKAIAAKPLSSRSLVVEGEEIPYVLYRMRRARRLTLRVNDDGEVVVRAPLRTNLRETADFVEKNSAWVLARLKAAHVRIDSQRALVDGALLPFLDGQLYLRLHDLKPEKSRSTVKRLDGELHLHSTCLERTSLICLVESWYRQQAKIYMADRLALLGTQLDLHAKKLTIRGQKTLWGSCTARGAISMNWRLMLAPARIVDYVLAHELCHLRHLNHSAKFWELLKQIEPDYINQRNLLRHMQSQLII
jgi:predicted metal-dependent hydrolase